MNKFTATEQDVIKNLARWREDPVAFVREVFGVEPDGKRKGEK